MRSHGLMLLALLFVISAGILIAQEDDPLTTDPECAPDVIAQQQEAFSQALPFDFENNPSRARDNLWRLAAVYQDLAVRCGYQPSEQEIDALIQITLSVADVSTILAANAVGSDIDAVMTELETVDGDSFTGQLLYNGIEPALDGTGLGCSGCHSSETAPPTEGTWTRVVEERLQQPEFADYTPERYLVESILHPNDYIVPDYMPQLMPDNYGSRMDIQQLADVLAYLEGQDQ